MLSNYNLALRTHERRAFLLKDSDKYGTVVLLQKLNTVRDVNQWNPRAHEIITKDLKFLECKYRKANTCGGEPAVNVIIKK